MKEIKFRCWCVNKNEWEKDIILITLNGGIIQLKNDIHIPCSLKTHILQQYTGLKDKNGVEIYEGDICKVDNIENFEVIWRGIGFWFKRTDEQCFVFTPLNAWIEVIGNIYENPELLQGEKNES